MTRITLFYLAFVLKLYYACTEGCLKCDPKEMKCLVCDFFNFYFNDSSACNQSFLQSCILASDQGVCEICKFGYYPDNGYCIKLLETQTVENCDLHLSLGVCKKCFEGYQLEKGACFLSEPKIKHCLNNLDPTKCEPCDLNLSMTKLIFCEPALEHIGNNTLSHINRESFNSIDVKILPRDIYLSLRKPSQIQKLVYSEIKNELMGIENDYKNSSLSACQSYLDKTNQCELCKPEYILEFQTHECYKSNITHIDNCKRLRTKNTCYECELGYFLFSKKVCKKIPKIIKFCQTYNQDYSVCKKCDTEYFLAKNLCIKRKKISSNCLDYDPTEDRCLRCKENFVLETIKSFSCLPAISNCLEHQFNYSNNVLKLTCAICTQPYKPDESMNKCEYNKQKQRGCHGYNFKGKCVICSKGYYLFGSECVLFPNFQLLAINSSLHRNILKDKAKYANQTINNPKQYIPDSSQTNKQKTHSIVEGRIFKKLRDHDKVDNKRFPHDPVAQKELGKTDINQNLASKLIKTNIHKNNYSESSIIINRYRNCKPYGDDKCFRYLQPGICDICIQKYVLNKEGNCVKGDIDNCLQYSNKKDLLSICVKCAPGFILENNKCRKKIYLFVNECEYSEGELCKKCKANHFPVFLYQSLNSQASQKIKNSTTSITSNSHGKPKNLNSFKNHSAAKDESVFQFCSPNVYSDVYPQLKSCLILNMESKQCDLCIEGSAKNRTTNICQKCDVLDETLTYCMEDTREYDNINCIVKSLTGQCLRCKENSTYINVSEIFVWVKKFLDYSKNSFIEIKEYPKKCNVQLSKNCSTDYCLEASHMKDGSICCKKCFIGKLGLVKVNSLGETFVSDCENNIPHCATDKIAKGISEEIFNKLSCYKCKDDRVLLLSNFPGDFMNQCEKINNPEDAYCLIRDQTKCLYCKPKYKRSNDTCVLIDNCLQSSVVEKCEKCQPDYYLNEDGTQCILNNDNGCYERSKEMICTKCFDGFALIKGNCTQIKHEYCNSFSGINCNSCISNSTSDIVLINVKTEFPLSLDQLNHPDPKLLKSICLPISKDQQNDNCIYYDNIYSCNECVQGYVLVQTVENYKKCMHKNLTKPNCIEFDVQNECVKCSNGFHLDKDKYCVPGNIAYCLIYYSSKICAQCEKGYFPYNFKNFRICFKNFEVSNCHELVSSEYSIVGGRKNNYLKENSIGCKKCASGFYSFETKFSQPMFFHIHNDGNCKQIDKNTGNCKTCYSNYFLKAPQANYVRSSVFQHSKMINETKVSDFSNTTRYHSSINQFASSESFPTHNNHMILKVETLSQPHFYPICVQRKNMNIPNCQIFSKTSDNCFLCKENYYLSANSLECVAVSDYLTNCKISNKGICVECKFGYLQAKGKCLKIQKNISGCLEYQDPSRCKQCDKKNYFVIDGGCSKITKRIKNCDIYESNNQCEKCLKGYSLKNERKCEKVKSYIDNCIYYQTKYRCSECESMFTVSSNGKCVSNVTINEHRNDYTDKRNTSLLSTNLIAKRNNNLDGCLFVKEDDETCFVCRPGWYQDQHSICRKTISGLKNSYPVATYKSEIILNSLFWMLLVLIANLFKN